MQHINGIYQPFTHSILACFKGICIWKTIFSNETSPINNTHQIEAYPNNINTNASKNNTIFTTRIPLKIHKKIILKPYQ